MSLIDNVPMHNVLQIIYGLISSVTSYNFLEIGNFISTQYRVPVFTLRSQDERLGIEKLL